ncbi:MULTISPECIES: EAL domain-containing protein [unclassified Symbiopectobacterium]|uniref:bifunctional diguanylate cyclase/phosphodiesterase n=3 Tax=Symbiopectobacterium TaxID=801 RepID=UPI002225E3E3|nr:MULTISPECIES: EAL domain-containing protein [unclassified Symbiopectobacterium]MCW2473981.1 EAL domain-containing protein [Candidatus Symbiopectobacterium sp. NZEC151]MCW2485224.1 EAL domain-containing protein [Candidatus Symbiopectobacterium sp. NZEC127]
MFGALNRAESLSAEAIAQQFNALDQGMAIAEFDLDGGLRRANQNYLSLFGYRADEICGWDHRQFCFPAFADSPAYSAFWDSLRQGAPHSDLVERQRRDGAQLWLEATYIPVRDDGGEVQHILKIAMDVSVRVQHEHDQNERLRRLSLVADATDTAVLISDAQWQIIYVNVGFVHMFGWTADEAIGQRPIALISPQQDSVMVEGLRTILRSGKPFEREEVLVGKHGQRYWAKVISNPVMNAEGSLLYTVSTLTDITSAKMHEVLQHQALEALVAERPLAEVLNLMCREVERIAPDIAATILEVDNYGKLHPLAGPSMPDEYSQALDGSSIGPKAGACGTAAFRNEVVIVDDIATDPLWEGYRQLILPLGYIGCWSTPVRNNHGQVIATFALYFRTPRNTMARAFHQGLIDACTHLCALALVREHERQRMRQLAFYDSLTGMPNRSLLEATTDQAIAAATRDDDEMAFLFIDLDRFKQINDSLGHPAGDELLRQVAARLRHELRAVDIAGRLSGDEFVVILPGCGMGQVGDRVEQLQSVLAEPMLLLGTSVSISASVGIAMFPTDGRDLDTLLHRADMAMYQAKSGGRGQSRFYSNEMNQLAQERLALETALRQALKLNQLSLHYQPQIELATGKLYGVEALARWTHPQLGSIPPTRFIPLAEDCGLIADLGRWALREACCQLAAWRDAGLPVPSVSVNLSPTSFHNLDLPRMIASTLASHALSPEHLTLELTESVLLDTNPNTMKTIAEVREQGVRLSMDDFGTGYSSLSYLRRLPVTELKLDRSFVADLEADEAARALSSAILGIGNSLSLTVVAEGIETPAQNRFLREQGYPVAQGYLFAKPMAPDQMGCWLAARKQCDADGSVSIEDTQSH